MRIREIDVGFIEDQWPGECVNEPPERRKGNHRPGRRIGIGDEGKTRLPYRPRIGKLPVIQIGNGLKARALNLGEGPVEHVAWRW